MTVLMILPVSLVNHAIMLLRLTSPERNHRAERILIIVSYRDSSRGRYIDVSPQRFPLQDLLVRPRQKEINMPQIKQFFNDCEQEIKAINLEH